MTKAKVKSESSKVKKTTQKVEDKLTTSVSKVKTEEMSTNSKARVSSKNTASLDKKTKVLELNVDRFGLSIAPGRVRRLLLDVVLNQQHRHVEKELKSHKDTLLEASNLKEGYMSYHGFSKETREYLREQFNRHVKNEKTKYERKQLKELLSACPLDESKKRVIPEQLHTLLETRKQLLKDEPNTDVSPLFEQYDKKYYKNFTEVNRIFSLTGEDAYKFYQSLVSRSKIRLNYSGNLRLTCYLELVLRQLLSQMLYNCASSNKTTVNFTSMAGSPLPENYLLLLVNTLTSWTTALEWQNNGRVVCSVLFIKILRLQYSIF